MGFTNKNQNSGSARVGRSDHDDVDWDAADIAAELARQARSGRRTTNHASGDVVSEQVGWRLGR